MCDLNNNQRLWLDNQLSKLEGVFAGNLGALNDAVYLCNEYQQPLPNWASIAVSRLINDLAFGRQRIEQKWRKWGRKYRQNMADYEVWSDVDEARANGAEWADVYNIVGGIRSNRSTDDVDAKPETIKLPERQPLFNKALWLQISRTIKAGKPRAEKNN